VKSGFESKRGGCGMYMNRGILGGDVESGYSAIIDYRRREAYRPSLVHIGGIREI
jgi:hypothetical protein